MLFRLSNRQPASLFGRRLVARPHRSFRLAVAALITGAAILTPAQSSQAAAGSYRLLIGEKLLPGQCLYSIDGYYGAQAKVCMDNYASITLFYNNKACWNSGYTGHTPSPNGYLIQQADGNVVIYQYPGGPARWASKTTPFRGGHTEIYADALKAARLAITDNHSYIFTYALCR